MKRHELDVVSLVSGVVFLLVSVGYLVEAGTEHDVDLGWLIPLALVLLGVAGLASAVRPDRSGQGDKQGEL